MNRKFGVFAAALAALHFTTQAADAGERKQIDPTLTAVTIGVGAAWTAVYFGLNHWRWDWDRTSLSVPQWGA